MDFASLTPLPGGWSGETFLAEAGGERQVVRIYAGGRARGPEAPEIDAALLQLVRGLLPVPDVLEVRRGDGDLPGLLVTTFLPGERGDLVLPRLGEREQALLGERVGDLVAALGAMPMLRAGAFTDGALTLGDLGGPDSLVEWAADRAQAWTDWSADERAGLLEVAARAERLLDTVPRRCLVHGDVNPKNLLVDRDSLRVTALLDWEFAHAGHPFTDLGNALRFDREPAYVGAVLDTYAGRHGVGREDALELARAADLRALVDLADRVGQNPVTDRAAVLLRTVSRTRDLAAG